MKRIYCDIDEATFKRYKAYLEMNDMKMADHVRLRVLTDVINWEREHPEELEYYRQLEEISRKLEMLKAP